MTIIFGGTGFIGIHYARYLLKESTSKIILADIKDILPCFLFPDIEHALQSGRLFYLKLDVRNIEDFKNIPKGKFDKILNFAAIHREPGHQHCEYYNTNIIGAENVCAWAKEQGCNNIIFTSSIAVYQPTGELKVESTVPAPISAYGGSKLAAELIHRAWQAEDKENRNLVIIRPGVVYGPSEGGNVTRMLKMIDRRLFVFIGNKETRKASIYVKELILIAEHLYKQNKNFIIANAVVPSPPSMGDYKKAIDSALEKKHFVPNFPFGLVYFLSFFIVLIPPIAKKTGIAPLRVKKLRRVNNIASTVLEETKYQFKYSLETAFADWYKEHPKDWKK